MKDIKEYINENDNKEHIYYLVFNGKTWSAHDLKRDGKDIFGKNFKSCEDLIDKVIKYASEKNFIPKIILYQNANEF